MSDTIFVGDLPGDFTEAKLSEIFGAYGTIATSKLLPIGPYGNRAAILTMVSPDEAAWIVENLNGNIPQGLEGPVKISFKTDKGKAKGMEGGKGWGAPAAWGKGAEGGCDAWGGACGVKGGVAAEPGQPCEALFIGNLPKDLDDMTLRTIFGAYGSIKQAKLLEPNSMGYRAAIIEFMTLEEAKWVQENLDGNLPEGLVGTESIKVKFKVPNMAKMMDGGCKGMVGFDGPYGKGAGKDGGKCGKGKCSIKTLVEGLMQSGAMPGGVKYSNDENTLFVGGLPSDTTDLDLFLIFSPFGPIAPRGVKAMLNDERTSCKGFGFVNFLTPEATQTASSTLNGTQMPDGSILTVTVKKEFSGKAAGVLDGGKAAAKGCFGKPDGGKGKW